MYDAVVAIDVCEPQEGSLKLHLIPVRDRLAQSIIRRMHWVDARDMLANGLVTGCIDRTLLHNVSNSCSLKLAHGAFTHVKQSVGSATKSSTEDPAMKPE